MADLYAEKIGFDLKPEDINCDGCESERGKLIGYCQSCYIRQCCREIGLGNCTHCNDQPFEKLTQFHESSTDAKSSFEALKREIG